MNWLFWQDPNTRLYRAGCGHKTRLMGGVRSEKTGVLSGVAIVPINGEIPFCHECLAEMTLLCDCCNHCSEIFPYDACFQTNLVRGKTEMSQEELLKAIIDLGYSTIICSLCGMDLIKSHPQIKNFLTPGRWLPQNGVLQFIADNPVPNPND